MEKELIKLNNRYWYISTYNIEEVEVLEKYDKSCKIHCITSYGTCHALYENIFRTKEEAIAEGQRRSKERENKISAEIKNPEDLFKMMLNAMYAEEYTDWEKISVAKEKIKEYFGIDIKEN